MTNQYIGVYRATRTMHARPLTEVADEVQRICAQYSGLSFEVIDSGRKANCRSVLSMLTKNIGYVGDGQPLEIKVIGDYPADTLKECADRVGRLFIHEAEKD